MGDELFLRDLVRRLAAPATTWARVRRAQKVVRGTVTRTEVVHALNVVEVTGDDGVTIGQWPRPDRVTCEAVALPPDGARGIVCFGEPAGGAIPGARVLEPIEPIVIPDDDGQISAALALVHEGAWTRALALRGHALQLALAAAMHARATDPLRARAASPIGDPLEEVLVRAARLGAGDDSAGDGFDGFALDDGTLTTLGYRRMMLGGKPGRRGPLDPEAPLPPHRI